MLNTLRRIVQEVNTARDLGEVLDIIVKRVKNVLHADVCSIYLHDEENKYFSLMASDGLTLKIAGEVKVAYNEGLVSLVAQRTDPLNLDDAQIHPRFKLFSSLDEEHYHAFLGVPIIHQRQVLGVLIVQSVKYERFSQDVVNFLVTIAAQLAGALIHAQVLRNLPSKEEQDYRPYKGQPGAPGIAIGQAILINASVNLEDIPDRETEEPEQEISLFLAAMDQVKNDISTLSCQLLSDDMPTEDVAVFDAYLLMLESQSLRKSTIDKIREGNWAQGAFRHTIEEHIQLFNEMDNPYLQERMKDIRDLGQCVVNVIRGERDISHQLTGKPIIVAEDISATALAELDKNEVSGIVLLKGSRTSHVAILARAMGIPTVVGVSELPLLKIEGNELIADGYSGKVYVNPPESVKKEYNRLLREEEELCVELQDLKDKPSETKDGQRLPLYANAGLVADIVPSIEAGAEGIGLYRTEYPFVIRQRFPGEEEQCAIYREVLTAFSPKPVVLRTLDIGGDKSLSYFPIEEDNPFLGWRGIRVTLDHPEIFLIQIRAMLIASKGLDNLNILLPMVSNINEVEESISLIEKAYRELMSEGHEILRPKIGVMVEVPSLVFQIKPVASLVDFISIGTNDLIQYLIAVDRNNARVANLYDALHPGVIRALNMIISQAHEMGVPVSVCGEMGSDPPATLLLLGMGVDSLSTSVSALPRVKWLIAHFTQEEAHGILMEALKMKDARTTYNFLVKHLEARGLGGLIRAGR